MVNHAHDIYDSLADARTSGPRRSRIRVGVRGGLVAAAATAGAVIGFGARHGDWASPFRSLGYEVLSGLGLGAPSALTLATGIFAHAAWMIVWGVLFAFVSMRRTAGTAIVIAIVVSVMAAMLARNVIPAAFGAVRFASLPGAQVVLCVVLATVGMLTARALDHR